VNDDDFLDNESAMESEFNYLNEDDEPKAAVSYDDKGEMSILACNSSFSSTLGFTKNQLDRKNITSIMSKKQSSFYYDLSRKINKANKESQQRSMLEDPIVLFNINTGSGLLTELDKGIEGITAFQKKNKFILVTSVVIKQIKSIKNPNQVIILIEIKRSSY
jgi:hypothetical protein